MRWSELPAARADAELSKLGISVRDLLDDAEEDVPGLHVSAVSNVKR